MSGELTCWFCEKELVEPTVTYIRRHRKLKKRTPITIHRKCFGRWNQAKWVRILPGSVDN